MRYASVCDGISAVSVAWAPLGWECAWCAEIDPFASAVLAERWPSHDNVGDMLAIDERIRDRGPIDLLVGGTPCQSFSVAGQRGGLADPRGNLALRFCQLAGVLRPRWIVWENVPGVLSSHGGRDFGAILGALVDLGYGFAYRVLDAQFFGVPQRRRRVFVVGCFGSWRSAAAVLFDRESLRGDSAKGRKTRASVAVCPTLRAAGNRTGGDRPPGTDVDTAETLQVVSALTANGVGTCGADDNQAQGGHLIAATMNGGMGRRRGSGQHGDGLVAATVYAKWAKWTGGPSGDECQNLVAAAVTCGPHGDGDEGAGRLVAYRTAGNGVVYIEGDRTAPLTTNTDSSANIVAYQCQGSNVGPMGTLRAGNGNETGGVPFVPVAFQSSQSGVRVAATHATLDANNGSRRHNGVVDRLSVRRLTPRECERLQGFPDYYTLVKYRNKPAADGPRYRVIGNSMAVPVMRWIGERIQRVDAIGGGP